jgi:Sec-independent protein translocase protein TatA
MSSSIDRLKNVLGFDPAQGTGSSAGAFKDALAELQAERDAENKVKAKDLLKKAMELRTKMDKAKKEFASQESKFEKELGKLLKTIEAMASGQEAPAEEPPQG